MQDTKQEVNGGKARYEKGMELYKSGRINIGSNGLFKVSGIYKVVTEKIT